MWKVARAESRRNTARGYRRVADRSQTVEQLSLAVTPGADPFAQAWVEKKRKLVQEESLQLSHVRCVCAHVMFVWGRLDWVLASLLMCRH